MSFYQTMGMTSCGGKHLSFEEGSNKVLIVYVHISKAISEVICTVDYINIKKYLLSFFQFCVIFYLSIY